MYCIGWIDLLYFLRNVDDPDAASWQYRQVSVAIQGDQELS